MKRRSQNWLDKNRRAYTLVFPADLDVKQVVAFLYSVSGTLKGSTFALEGVPTIAFELWSTDKGIQHRIKVPWQHAEYVINQMASAMPGLRWDEEESGPDHDWTAAVELGESKPRRTLRILSPETLSASLLSSTQPLKAGEAMLMQLVVTPAIPERPPSRDSRAQTDSWKLNVLLGAGQASSDEIAERRAKLAEPNMLAVLRVAAKAETEPRAYELMHRLKAALAATRTADNKWTRRPLLKGALMKRLACASGSLLFPAQLSISELASIIAWPVGNPPVAGLPRGRTRYLPPSEGTAREGRVIGVANYPRMERPLAISAEDACKHVYILGPSGVGKTALMTNMAAQDMAAGHGVIVLESKGDLFNAVLASVPRERVNDVVVVDLTDRANPVGFNIFEQGEPGQVVDDLMNLMDDGKGIYLRDLLYHGTHTLLRTPGTTFIDLVPLLRPQNTSEEVWRDSLIDKLPQGELRDFWTRYRRLKESEKAQQTQPLIQRMWQLSAREDIRNVIGQSQSTFKMTDVLRDNRILLINLPASLGKETVGLVSSLFMQALWNGARLVRSPLENFAYVDEYQTVSAISAHTSEMLDQARSFRLGLTVAHQFGNQLDRHSRDEVLNNTATKIIFRTSAQDATWIQPSMGSTVTVNDFVNQGKFEGIARIAGSDGSSAPVTLQTKEPPRPTGAGEQARAASRAKYGRPKHEVDVQISARRRGPEKPVKSRPSIGFEDVD